MPIREYHCDSCQQNYEQIEFAGTNPLHQCPTCAGPVRRRPAAPAIRFVGYGWTPKTYKGGAGPSEHDTLEETENGQLREKTGAGHNAP